MTRSLRITLILLALGSNAYALDFAPMAPREDAQFYHVHTHDNCCTLDQFIDVASMEPMKESSSGKSTSVIDSYMIEELKPLHLIDSIVNTPGVVTKDITGLGSVRIRGARSFDTKYLFDGFPLKDPSHPQGSWGSFFGDTTSFGNSEIQLLRGSGSVLYGSDSIGGALNIVPIVSETSFTTEYGSHQSFLQSFDSVPASFTYGNSIDYETVNLRLQNEVNNMEPFFIYQSTEAPLHNAPFLDTHTIYDIRDENDRRETWYWQAGTKISHDYFKAKISYSDSSRRFLFLPNSDGTGFFSDGYFNGQSIFADINTSVLDTTLGYTFTRDFMEIETSPDSDTSDRYQNDLYLERKVEIGDINILLGSRYSIHEISKNRFTYDISASYNLDGYILRSHYGTGYRVPSLYELHGAFLSSFGRFEIGNQDLSPERSESFDVGVEKTWNDKTTVGLTGFWHNIKNKIDFIGSGYVNVDGENKTYGYEAYYEQFLFGKTSLRASYTRTIQSGLLDVSPYEAMVTLRTSRKRWSLFSGIGYKSDHEIALFDINTFTVPKVHEGAYWTSFATTSYKVSENVEVYARIENVLDEVYYDGGYKKDGFNVYAGVKISI